MFSTWGPKVIALIGKITETLHDRSIIIPLTRKMSDEVVEQLRMDRVEEFHIRAREMARWAEDHSDKLRSLDPEVPATLNDRAADNWRPVLAIADLIGGEWPEMARNAAVLLSADKEDSSSMQEELLGDIYKIFVAIKHDRIRSSDLLVTLTKMEDRPWKEWKNGRSMTMRNLSDELKQFNIRPGTHRIGGDSAKGYLAEQFNDSFRRYLGKPAVTDVTQLQNHQLSLNFGESR